MDGVEELEIVVADSGPGLGPDAAGARVRARLDHQADRPPARPRDRAGAGGAGRAPARRVDRRRERGGRGVQRAAAAARSRCRRRGARGGPAPPRASPSTSPADPSRASARRRGAGWSERGVRCVDAPRRFAPSGPPRPHPVCRPARREDPAVRIAMVQGRADPERDGVADYVRHLSAALTAAGEEVVPVPVLGPREAADAAARAATRTSRTSSSPPRRSASRRGPGCSRTWCAACRSSPRCTSTAGGPPRGGCRARCGARWSAPAGGTARPGGSPPAAARCSRRTRGTPRVVRRAARPHGRPGAARPERPRSAVARRTAPTPAAGSACPPTPRSSRSSGSCTRSRACAT